MPSGAGIVMNLWRNLAVMGLCLTAGATSVLAQTTTSLVNGNSVTLDGLTATISGFSCTSGACSSNDILEVVAVSRDNIEFEIVNTGGSTSSILVAPTGIHTGSETLGITLTIKGTAGYNHEIGTPSSAIETATGYNYYNTCTPNCNSEAATGSSTFSGTGTSATTNPLTGSLTVKTGTQTQESYTSPASGSDSITTPSLGNLSNSFTIASTLTLTNNGKSASRVEFDAYALTLHTAPEPASIAVMLCGLGGLAMVRRRRRMNR
jgi:hypothetical protein